MEAWEALPHPLTPRLEQPLGFAPQGALLDAVPLTCTLPGAVCRARRKPEGAPGPPNTSSSPLAAEPERVEGTPLTPGQNGRTLRSLGGGEPLPLPRSLAKVGAGGKRFSGSGRGSQLTPVRERGARGGAERPPWVSGQAVPEVTRP